MLVGFCLRNKDDDKKQEFQMIEEPEDKENERKKEILCVQEILSAQKMTEVESLLRKISQIHQNFQQIGFCLLGLKKQSEEYRSLEEIRKFATTILLLEMKHHGSSTDCHRCLKTNLNRNEYILLIENSSFSWKLWCLQKYYDIRNCFGKPNQPENGKGCEIGKSIWKILKRLKNLSITQLDLVKDVLILVILVNLTSLATLSDPQFFSYFSTQFIILWALSVFVPITMSTLRNIFLNPLLTFGTNVEPCCLTPFKKNLLRLALAIIFFPFVMGLVFLGDEIEKEKLFDEGLKFLNAMKMNLDSRNVETRMRSQIENIEKNKMLILNIKKLEVTETSLQIILQVIMLVLFHSRTKTNRGLEAFFGVEQETYTAIYISNTVFLFLSIILSIKKTVFNIVSSKSSQDEASSTLGKLLIALRALITNTVRTMCVIFFFTPYLGLWNIFQHLQVGQIF